MGVTDTLRSNMREKRSMSVLTMLSAIGVAALHPKEDYISQSRSQLIRGRAIPIISQDINLAVIEFQQLVKCLRAYAESGRSQQIIQIYRIGTTSLSLGFMYSTYYAHL